MRPSELGELNKLTSLNVKGNNIALVGASVLTGSAMPALRDLQLSGNRFSNPCSVGLDTWFLEVHFCTLPLGCAVDGTASNPGTTLVSCKNFTGPSLDLENHHLSAIAANAFAGLASVTSLALAGNPITAELPQTLLAPTPALTSLSIAGLRIGGSAGFGPRLGHLASLRALDITAVPLQKLSNSTLQGLGALQVLTASDCGMQVVEAAAFSHCPSLRELHLAGNALARAPHVSGLALTVLDLTNNTVAGGWQASGFAAQVPSLVNLTTLKLRGNALGQLPVSAFAGLASLQELDLGNCSLQQLPRRLLSAATMPALRTLYLDHNAGLFLLPTSAFAGLSLSYLSLSAGAGFSDPCLVGHRTVTLDQVYCTLPCTATLHGHVVSCAGFANATLDMSSAGIKSFAVDAFQGASSVVRLLLGNNPSLSSIASDALFAPLGPSLETIDLHGSNLTTVPPSLFSERWLPRLATVDLAGATPSTCPPNTMQLRTRPALGDYKYCAACTGASCECPPGNRQVDGAAPGTCELCAPGSTQAGAGQTQCELCGNGTYYGDYGGSNSSWCAPCGSAKVYCPPGSAAPLGVSPGWYSMPMAGDATLRSWQAKCSEGYQCK